MKTEELLQLAQLNHFNLSNREYISEFLKFEHSKHIVQDFLRHRNSGNKLPASRFSRLYWTLRGYSEDEACVKIKEIQGSHTSRKAKEEKLKALGLTEEQIAEELRQMGIRKGVSSSRVHKEQKEKDPLYVNKMSRFFKEFWMKKGYPEEESMRLAAKASEDNRKRFKEKLETGEIEKGWNTTTLEYWLKKGHSLPEAQRLLKERQATFTLEKCILRHGEEKGTKIWNKRQEDWKRKVFSVQQYIGGGQSKVARSLFLKLNEENALFGKDEIFMRNKHIVYKYDFCVKEKKKIIEFNGDYWHCNPSLYSPDFYNRNKLMTAQEIRDFDNLKESHARSKGYDYLVIWESEYKLNPERTINKCKIFLEK